MAKFLKNATGSKI